MEEGEIKKLFVKIKTHPKWKDEYTNELARALEEMIPQLEISRSGNELEISAPLSTSKSAIKLRLKKFLHKKKLTGTFRPISQKTDDQEGFLIIEKKTAELAYY
ncbi:MAG: hypothetical protein ACTSRH_08685 [Promethearchaeota archaeon]